MSIVAGSLFTLQQWTVSRLFPQMCFQSKYFSLAYDEVNVKTLSEKGAHPRGHFSHQGRHYVSVLLSWLICHQKRIRDVTTLASNDWHFSVCARAAVETACQDVTTIHKYSKGCREIFSLITFFFKSQLYLWTTNAKKKCTNPSKAITVAFKVNDFPHNVFLSLNGTY